ncbi:hypothetical protein INS49_002408 [Diaporthe citri]|uniref:uncharacterized protein n=1 Tax=Diaporthe citri TaxID=83186 RepID=UPI001C7FEB3F|nr:uncharacterized protein INS49_002408 [Diaporthe citri]KAG6368207.1 hypothetical protein INS49_002408 [Diaporthe citri]
MLSHSVMTLAKNLYTSNARFVFELLQNAEDNRYTRAQEQGHAPYVSFQVYNDRIIIEYNEDGFKEENVRAICDVGRSSKAIRQQFNDLQENVLLFMRNLREIRISFLDNNGRVQSSTVFSASKTDARRIKLTKSVTNGAEVARTSQIYHVTKHSVKSLPKHDDRTYSEEEGHKRAYAGAEIILAFPISDASVPVIKPQDVFAFLPMRHMGFSANRQDIVATSPRNQGIIEHISDAFIHSVLEFCEHPALRYTWMRFLPNKTQYPYDNFWSILVNLIESKLHNASILLPQSEDSLRKISDLRELDPCLCDSKGEPLFRDVTPKKWLSRLYHREDV